MFIPISSNVFPIASIVSVVSSYFVVYVEMTIKKILYRPLHTPCAKLFTQTLKEVHTKASQRTDLTQYFNTALLRLVITFVCRCTGWYPAAPETYNSKQTYEPPSPDASTRINILTLTSLPFHERRTSRVSSILGVNVLIESRGVSI